MVVRERGCKNITHVFHQQLKVIMVFLVILLGHKRTLHRRQRHMATTKRKVYVLAVPVKRWLKARAPNRVVIKLNDLVCAMTIRKCRQKLQNQQLS